MKKLSVILLALAMTLSLAVVASAANFEPYLGGEFQVTYIGAEDVEDTPIYVENGGTWARFKLMLTGTVEDEETGTWAKIGAKLHTWGEGRAPIYEAGIKGLFDGTLDVWFNGHEYENAKRGQIPLWTPMAKFGGDPLFDAAPGNVFAFDYNSGNITFNLGYDLNKPTFDSEKLLKEYKGKYKGKNTIITAATLNFDMGKAHFAYQGKTVSITEDDVTVPLDETRFLVGGELAFDFGTIALDYHSVNLSNDDEAVKAYNDGNKVDVTKSALQAAISLNDLGLKGTFVLDKGAYFSNADDDDDDKFGGMGFGIEYTGIENLTIGARMMRADKKEYESKDMTDIYVGYKFGVFDTRVGVYKVEGENDGDNVFYAAAHVGMW